MLQCIAKNIQITQMLIDMSTSGVSYVESHAAGQVTDQLTLVRGTPQFADRFVALGNVEVEGIGNRELFDQQHLNLRSPSHWLEPVIDLI